MPDLWRFGGKDMKLFSRVYVSPHARQRLKQRTVLSKGQLERRIWLGRMVIVFELGNLVVGLIWVAPQESAFIVVIHREEGDVAVVGTIYKAKINIPQKGYVVLPEHVEKAREMTPQPSEKKYHLIVRERAHDKTGWRDHKIASFSRSLFDDFEGSFTEFLAEREDIVKFFEENEFPTFSEVRIVLKKRSGMTIAWHLVTRSA